MFKLAKINMFFIYTWLPPKRLHNDTSINKWGDNQNMFSQHAFSIISSVRKWLVLIATQKEMEEKSKVNLINILLILHLRCLVKSKNIKSKYFR